MKRLIVFLFVFIFAVANVFAGALAGRVFDSQTGKGLAGANIFIENSVTGSSADEDGMYYFEVDDGTYTVVCTYVGFVDMKEVITVSGEKTLLNFNMKSSIMRTSEIIVEASRAKERETPVAFTDVGGDDISMRFNVQDVPHLFVNTPGVYVTSDGGSGMGDSKVYIRGFDEQRISVMINNIEVNDPESKKVYWSNWGSLPSGSQSIQIQRGAGSSLYGAGAFGGSINVLTADAPAVQSFNLTSTTGLYNTYKLGADYNSGLFMNNKMSVIGRLNYMTGNGWRDDTFYKGVSYYFGLSYFMNEKHTMRLVLHGAPQYHAYTYYSVGAKDYANWGRSYNSHPYVEENDPGLTDREKDGTDLLEMLMFGHNDKDKGGEVIGNGQISFDNNVYHKPQLELHHTWDINKNSYLQTNTFASMGRGYGENVNNVWAFTDMGYRDGNGRINMRDISDMQNQSSFANGDYNFLRGTTYQYRAYSIHNQFGIVSTYNTKWNEHELSAGAEARYWWARHYRMIINNFGAETSTFKVGNEKAKFREGDVYEDYTGVKPNFSVFGHGLWKFGDLSIMTDLQFSSRIYKITEDFPSSNNRPDPNGDYILTQNMEGGNNDGYINYADTTFSLLEYDKTYNFVSPKLGVNYNINEHFNIFGNYSRVYNEPRVKSFFNYGQPNDKLNIETSDDFELGLGFVDRGFAAKVNLYQINFDNKAYQIQDPTKTNQPGYDYKGRRYVTVGSAVYRGIEIATNMQINRNVDVNLSLSRMKNEWGDNISEEAKNDLGIAEGKIEPGAPQLMLSGVANYINGPFYLSAAGRFNKDYYILPSNGFMPLEYDVNRGLVTKSGSTLPSWGVFDLILGWRQPVAGVSLNAALHFNNLFNGMYYQIGNEYGIIPGPERNVLLNLTIGI